MPSSVIRSFHYLQREQQLEIEFVTGRRYRYLAVPEHIHAAMRQAFSKGEYFNRRDSRSLRLCAARGCQDRVLICARAAASSNDENVIAHRGTAMTGRYVFL